MFKLSHLFLISLIACISTICSARHLATIDVENRVPDLQSIDLSSSAIESDAQVNHNQLGNFYLEAAARVSGDAKDYYLLKGSLRTLTVNSESAEAFLNIRKMVADPGLILQLELRLSCDWGIFSLSKEILRRQKTSFGI